LTHTAAADQRPFTSGVSPRIGIPSGVSEISPLIAYFTPTDSSPTISGIRSSASASCGSKSACVNGNSVGESAAASIDGISSGSWTIDRCAYEPISRLVPSWRSYMKTSMSRTIGNSIARELCSNRGTGPTSIIWCTIGVSGMCAPAIAARSGLHTPHAITTVSASIVPLDVSIRRIRRRSTAIPWTSVFGRTVRPPEAIPCSRMSVPARSESTTPTPGV
jgi:hypothetical protein